MLELRSVSFGYGNTRVVDNVSFAVREGDFLGIIGPNGAGKTTLFRLITGIIEPWEGTILFREKNIFSIPRKHLARQVATMPQLFETPFSFSVEEFVQMGRFPHRAKWEPVTRHDRDAVEEALALTGTPGLRRRTLGELSGGERQRVILAQALAQEPRLLLLDEPTSHLDIGHQVEILDLTRKLNRDNRLTVMMVIHDLNLASEYCDRLIMLSEGTVFSQGEPREVLTYQGIEEVYKTVVVVEQSPFSHKPYVFLVSKENLKDKNCR